MGKGKSAPAPAAPDPYKTAQAEAQFNRLDTYSPSGSGVRYGYTAPAGTAIPIETIAGTPASPVTSATPFLGGGKNAEENRRNRERNAPVQAATPTQYRVNGQTFATLAAAEAYRNSLGPGGFIQGTPPPGFQSAVQQIESPWEKAIREALQPASVDLTNRVIRDNITNMPDAPRVQDRGDIAKTIFDRSFAMMMPAIEKGNTRLLTNLQARGIPIGGEAFNDAYGEQQTRTQDTISRLAMDADMAAGQEQTRLFGLDAASRQGAIAELVAAMGGGYNPPSATPSGSAAGVNYSGLVSEKYRNDMAAYENQQAQRSSTMSTLGGLGGALLMKSSRDWKDDHGTVSIHNVAEGVTRIPIHEWSYAPGVHVPGSLPGQRHVGPMAQDFQQVFGLGDGRHINVIDAFGICMAALKSALLRIEVLERRSFGVGVN